MRDGCDQILCTIQIRREITNGTTTVTVIGLPTDSPFYSEAAVTHPTASRVSAADALGFTEPMIAPRDDIEAESKRNLTLAVKGMRRELGMRPPTAKVLAVWNAYMHSQLSLEQQIVGAGVLHRASSAARTIVEWVEDLRQ